MNEPISVPIINSPVEAQSPKDPNNTGLLENNPQTPVPLSNYSDVFQKTYTEKFFDIGVDGHSKPGIGEIEEYIQSRIQEQGLKNTTEVYDRLMEELFAKIGVDNDEENVSKFFKTHTYIKMLEKMDLLKTLEDAESIDNKIARLLARRK